MVSCATAEEARDEDRRYLAGNILVAYIRAGYQNGPLLSDEDLALKALRVAAVIYPEVEDVGGAAVDRVVVGRQLNNPDSFFPSQGSGVIPLQIADLFRAEGAEARQEEIRLAMLAEADRINNIEDRTEEAYSYDEHADIAINALRLFAERLDRRRR